MDKAADWLPTHPRRELIVRRYLDKSGELRDAAMGFLESQDSGEVPSAEDMMEFDACDLDDGSSPHDDRHRRIVDIVEDLRASRVLDLGCGDGKLLARLAKSHVPKEIVGMEPSRRDLEKARKRLSSNPAKAMDPRVGLIHGSLAYADERLAGFDVAILSEVIEHIDPDRLSHVERSLFGSMKPKAVILTTPNGSYSTLFANLYQGRFRHPDHRFEWTVPECEAWADRVATTYGYKATVEGIGPFDDERGHLSHLVIFKKDKA
jgi:3' terminal RNA ribose 2'-O-methyltransferase Hen1